MGAYQDAGVEARERRERSLRDAWRLSQDAVWGDGPEFRRLCESISKRNDEPGTAEADGIVERMVAAGATPADVAKAVVEWALAEMPDDGAFRMARARVEINRDWLIREMDGLGYPHGSPLKDRPSHSVVHTVVNCLLRGRTSDRA
jgi:hypothetical protein